MTFTKEGASTPVLLDVNFTVDENEFVSILGPSGCGKSTLLRMIAGLTTPTSGEITFKQEADSSHIQCGMVFQEFGLYPWMTVFDNVQVGQATAGKDDHACHEIIERMGLSRFSKHFPHELSGGMKQRVGIARAYVSKAPLLLMDEPFGALDEQTKRVMQEELLQLWRAEQKTILYVTHDISEAIRLSDRILLLGKQPARIKHEMRIELPRPRSAIFDNSQEELVQRSRYEKEIWSKMETDVKSSMDLLAHDQGD